MSSTHSSNSKLRKVRTSYDLEAVNKAVGRGYICLIRKRIQNFELRFSQLILRNRKSGEFIEVPSREFFTRQGRMVYGEEEWAFVQEVEGYARPPKNEGNWGAYILPPDPRVGEEFLIADLIEDLLATKFWYSVTAAETAIATWDGKDLVIDHSSYCMEIIG